MTHRLQFSVKTRPRYGDFSIFKDGGRPPSWICCVSDWTTHEGRLVVFITVQNMVGIDAIICMFEYFVTLAWKRLFTPLLGGFGGTVPPKNVTHRPNPQKDRPWAESRHLSHKAWISAARFELGVGTRKQKGQHRKKVTKYFIYLGRSPHSSDLRQKLCNRWTPRRNQVCQVSKWNFQGLRF